MEPIVTIVDIPHAVCGIEQSISICRRSQNRPCWKDVSSVNLKTPVFRQAGQGQGSKPKSIGGFFDDMETIFVVQATVGTDMIELRGVQMKLMRANTGCPDTPQIEIFKPFPLELKTKYGHVAAHTDTLSLSLDHEKMRLFAMYSNFGTTRLFCHTYGKKKEWLEIALPSIFQPSTMVKDGLVFSLSHMSGGELSSLSTRAMLDLRDCKEMDYQHYGPYTIEMDNKTNIELRIMDVPGVELKDMRDLIFKPADKMYYSASASGPVLITGQSYTIDLSLGGRVWAYDAKGTPIELPVHTISNRTHTTIVPRLQTDRMQLGRVKHLKFSVQGSGIAGIKTGPSKYIVADHIVSGMNRISSVNNELRDNIDFLSRTDAVRDHSHDMPHLFAESGDLIDINRLNGQIYVHTRRNGDSYNLHQLWQVINEKIDLVSSLTVDSKAFVFAEHHNTNVFNNFGPKHMCLCTLFNEGRLFTCTCAGDFAETNRSADAFTGKKGYLRGNWDLYYMRGNPDPIADDPSIRACIVY